MFSLFPQLLDYQFPAIAIIRVAAGLMFLYIAWRMIITRDDITKARVIIVGHIQEWMVWTSAIVTFIVGMLLIVGLWTQGAAILGMLISLKHGLGVRRYSDILPLAGSGYFLLFVICLSLLFLGAGKFAFDLPL
jgi:uncharacterized membrane protein YphA (DoxX/SURF4 family)